MHQIVATRDGIRTVLVETPFCESAFEYFCFYLNDYTWNELSIEGECDE